MDSDAWAAKLARRNERARSVAAGAVGVPVLFALSALVGRSLPSSLLTGLWIAAGLLLGAWRRGNPLAAGAGVLSALLVLIMFGITRSDDGTAAVAFFILPIVSPGILGVIALGAFAARRFGALAAREG